MPLPPRLFFALLLLGSLALAAGYAALVLNTASWAEARSLDQLFPYYDWHIRPFGPAAWQHAQRLLTGLAAGLAGAWLALGPATRAGRTELGATGRALRPLWAGLAGTWRALPGAQRRLFWGHLAVLTAVRLYLSLTTPWGDDAVSFEFFVRQRLLAVAAYYPLPNNHVLSNTLAWGFYQLHPAFWWAMRLPVLLTSTVGTGLLFGSMLRRLGYWPALLTAGAMSWVQLSLSHAAVGRGYWLVVCATVVVFASLLALLDQPTGLTEPSALTRPIGPLNADGSVRPVGRLPWLGLLGASLVGAYAVPTFAYVLASAFAWLGLQAAWYRRWGLLAWVVAVGLAAGLGIGLLYAPTLYVSGPAALLANAYVRQLAAGEFWRGLPAHAWFTEGYLLGQRHVGALGTLLVLGLFGRLLGQWRAGRLAPGLARQVRQVGLPALWFGLFPYALLLGQRVLPPERTWLYKSWFLFLLLGLVLKGWPGGGRRPVRRRVLAAGVGLFVCYQVASQLRLNYQARQGRADHRAVFGWLAAHPQAGPVLIPDIYLWGWLRFQTHIATPGHPWLPDYQRRPGVAYAYSITRLSEPRPAGTVVFADGQLLVTHLRQLPRPPAPAARRLAP